MCSSSSSPNLFAATITVAVAVTIASEPLIAPPGEHKPLDAALSVSTHSVPCVRPYGKDSLLPRSINLSHELTLSWIPTITSLEFVHKVLYEYGTRVNSTLFEYGRLWDFPVVGRS